MELKDFCTQFNIPLSEFKKNEDWDSLLKIKADYHSFIQNIDPISSMVTNSLQKIPNVKYVKYRIKDPAHLIEKIYRKNKETVFQKINIRNYKNSVTDLIGVRVLHLFKDDWKDIHNFITKTWELKEKPIAYVREGDNVNIYKKNKLKIMEHPRAYRSIHYVIKCQPNKVVHNVEIQVRTIFEEAWSEIDHSMKYPYDLNNKIIAPYLIMFNRLAGSADEMGSYVKFLKNQIIELENNHKNEISNLQTQIDNMEIKQTDKSKLKKELELMRNIKYISSNNLINMSQYYDYIAKYPINEFLNKETKISLKRKRKK